MSDWKTINKPPEPVQLDLTRCCVPSSGSGSPIDAFYDTIAHILTLGGPSELDRSPTLGRLLVLGLVTGTEAYFRSLLLGITNVCPIAREAVADQQLAFGAIDFYGVEQAALGLFEGASFASAVEIKKRTKVITGVSWSDNDSLGVALENFEQVCHMRHAAVHAQGVLNRGNARALGVARGAKPLHVVVDLPHLHLAAKACTGLVKAYNHAVYLGIVQRWLNNRVLVGSWKIDKPRFHPLFELFASKSDGTAPRSSYFAYRSLQPSISSRLTGP